MGGLNRDFWRGRKVFLTGHTGFKGGWLSLWLADMGARVTGYALRPPTQPNLFELAGIADSVRTVTADIRDRDTLREAMQEAEPDIVIHLAAQPLVLDSYRNPAETYEINVMGTVNLLKLNHSILLKYSEKAELDPYSASGKVSLALLEELMATASIIGRA